MKHTIEQWLKDNTVVIRAHDGTMVIALKHKFEFASGGSNDYNAVLSQTASEISATIENAKGGH